MALKSAKSDAPSSPVGLVREAEQRCQFHEQCQDDARICAQDGSTCWGGCCVAACRVLAETADEIADLRAEVRRLEDSRITVVEVTGHAGQPVAAPCCLDGCQYGRLEAERDDWQHRWRRMSEAYIEAATLHKKAESSLSTLQAERDKLTEGTGPAYKREKKLRIQAESRLAEQEGWIALGKAKAAEATTATVRLSMLVAGVQQLEQEMLASPFGTISDYADRLTALRIAATGEK